MMGIPEYREALAKLDPETRKIIGQLVQDSLDVGLDRPEIELRNIGYERYDKREREYQEFVSFADALIKGTIT